jgi:hypothetical protein
MAGVDIKGVRLGLAYDYHEQKFRHRKPEQRGICPEILLSDLSAGS